MANLCFAAHGFPMIYPLNSSGSCIEGFIKVLDTDLFIRLRVINAKPRKKVSLQGCWKLTCLLKANADTLHERLSACNTVPDMLVEVRNFLENKMKVKEASNSDDLPVEYYQILLKHVQELGNERIYFVDPDFKVIEVRAYDESNREHILHMNIPPTFPRDEPTYYYDLPEHFSFDWCHANTLLDVYNHFESTLTKYYDFWRWMNEIDDNTWVLGPENITPATCKRRIAVAPTASLLIIVDPSCPSALPSCQYMGPDEVIQPLREMFSRNIDQWDEGLSLLCNLRRVFNVEFPSPLTSNKEEFCVDCGICYSYKLGDSIPDVICSNSKCHQPFHQACLYEWLKMSKSAIQTSNKIGGECPCCNESIWCGLPELDSGKMDDFAPKEDI